MKSGNSRTVLRRYHLRQPALYRKHAGTRFNAGDIVHKSFTRMFANLERHSISRGRKFILRAEKALRNIRAGSLGQRRKDAQYLKSLPEELTAVKGFDASLIHGIPLEVLFGFIDELPHRNREAFCRQCFDGYRHERVDEAEYLEARALLIKKIKDYLLNS